VSKQDRHFFNVFFVAIAGLVIITLGIFAYARHVGSPFEEARVLDEERQDVGQRIAPAGHVAIAGQDNTALAIKAPAPKAGEGPSVAALPKNGEETYKATCFACHGTGAAGAPRFADKAAWAPRLATGKATLYTHALQGFKAMPAKGANPALSDELVREAVDYMAKAAQ
jgi:cytochrome c5